MPRGLSSDSSFLLIVISFEFVEKMGKELCETTTQYRYWRFNREQLQIIRQQVHERYVEEAKVSQLKEQVGYDSIMVNLVD
jgi:hypothetical protein